jgi:nondiscriminating glutamyl-tRNA synthetase
LGWSPEGTQEIFTLEELKQAFSVSRISKSGSIFDIEKLKWMNGMYLRAMTLDQFHELCLPYFKEAIHIPCDLKEVSKMLQQRLHVYEELEDWKDVALFQARISELPTKLGFKNGQVYWPIRTAVSGKAFTPGGALEIPYLLGKEESIRRTLAGIEKLKALD